MNLEGLLVVAERAGFGDLVEIDNMNETFKPCGKRVLSCGTLSKVFNLSVPQTPPLENRANHGAFLRVVERV